MTRSIKVSTKFRLGEVLRQDFSEINLGKYTLHRSPNEHLGSLKTELLLNFIDDWKEGQIVLSWLSTILKQKLKVISSSLNDLQFHNKSRQTITFKSPIDFPNNILELYNKFKSLPLEILERYARACECYQEALLVSDNNPTISFFLFVVCVECMSNRSYNFYEYLMRELAEKNEISKKEIGEIYNKFNKEHGSKKSFIEFILFNFEEWKEEFNKEDFIKLLSSIYDIRSLFTHEGEDLTKHIELIDNLKSKTIFTNIKDKKLEFPALNYLSEIVREVLINFIERQQDSDADNIPELALKDSLVNLDLIKDEAIKKGSFIFKNQIKHRD